jgi:hypothetical protein
MPWKAFGFRARTHPFRLESVGTCCVESFEPRKQNLTKPRPKGRKSGDCETSKAAGTRGHATGIMSCHICWRQISSDVTLLPVQWCFPSGWSVSVARFCCNGFNVVSPQELSKTWSQYVYQYISVLFSTTSYVYIIWLYTHIYIYIQHYIISYHILSYYIISYYIKSKYII